MHISIYQEQESDYQAVENLIQSAFKNAPHSDGTEHLLVGKLRNSPAFIRELSLVAKVGEQIVGHILFSKIQIGDHTGLALAPLAVLPEYQGKGVGKALIHQGHLVVRELGFDCVVVLGEPAYYGKFGYQTAKPFGISAPLDVPEAYYQVLFFGENLHIQGMVVYDRMFF